MASSCSPSVHSGYSIHNEIDTVLPNCVFWLEKELVTFSAGFRSQLYLAYAMNCRKRVEPVHIRLHLEYVHKVPFGNRSVIDLDLSTTCNSIHAVGEHAHITWKSNLIQLIHWTKWLRVGFLDAGTFAMCISRR